MSEPKPSLAARLTATALSLFESTTVAEQQAPETTASRARSASPASTLTSLAPSPYKSRAQPADFRSPLKQGQLPTPSPTSDASTQLLPAPAPLPTRKMPRASLAHSVSAVHDDLKEWLDSGLYYTPPALAEAAGPSSPPPPKPLRQRPPARQASLRRPKDDFDWRKIKQPRSFPMPMYYGVTLLSEERPFKLSFDVLRDGAAFAREGKGVRPLKDEESAWARAEREKLEGSKKPPPYRSIPKNFYFERRPEKSDHPAVCACQLPADPELLGCREDCMNRLMQYTCDKKTCPCGARCSNVPLSERDAVPEGKDGLRIIWTGERGFGLKTMRPLVRGQFVMEYRGEIISRDESYKRVLTVYKEAKSYYFLDYDGYDVIDAGQRGNSSRFINHSCGPNVRVVRWKMASMEEYQMGLFALHDIPADTELTYDYGWQDFSMMRPNPNDPTPMPISADPARQRCFCGASVCSGFLGGKKKEVERKKESVRGEEKSATPEVEGKAKGKGKAAVKAVVEKMKEAVGAKKTAAKMGGSKPPSAVAGKGKVKPESKASSSSSSKGGPSSAAAKKKAAADVKVVVPKSALVASPAPSGRGKAKPAEVELAFVKSPRRPPTPRG